MSDYSDNDSATTVSFYESDYDTTVSFHSEDSDNDTVVSLYEFDEEDKRNKTHISIVSFLIILLALIIPYLY